MANSNIPRYRTIKECLIEVKKLDSETAISEWYIRQLTKQNEIDFLQSGNKILINLDSLLEFLNHSSQPSKNQQSKSETYFGTHPFKRH